VKLRVWIFLKREKRVGALVILQRFIKCTHRTAAEKAPGVCHWPSRRGRAQAVSSHNTSVYGFHQISRFDCDKRVRTRRLTSALVGRQEFLGQITQAAHDVLSTNERKEPSRPGPVLPGPGI
jgi:hypothetical protein